MKYWSMWFILRPIQNCTTGYIDMYMYLVSLLYLLIYTYIVMQYAQTESIRLWHWALCTFKISIMLFKKEKIVVWTNNITVILYMPWIDVIWTNNVQWMGDYNEYFGNHASSRELLYFVLIDRQSTVCS